MRKSCIALVILFLVSACTGISEEKIAEKMKEKYESIEDYTGIMIMESQIGNEIQHTEMEVKFKKPYYYWTKDLKTGIITVSNEKTTWIYDPQRNTATKIEISEEMYEYIKKMRERIDYGKIIEKILEEYDVKLLGSEKVEGRDCYVLDLKEKNDSMHIKMWVDKEYWMPIKMETEMKIGNEVMKTIAIYKNLKFNVGLSEKDFEFTPPEGAKIIERKLEEPEKMSLEEAEQKAGFKVLMPCYIPSGFKFEGATVLETVEGKMVSMRYRSGEKFLTITELLSEEKREDKIGEEVDINGIKGRLVTFMNITSVKWICGELTITVSGNIDKEEVLKVARSIEC